MGQGFPVSPCTEASLFLLAIAVDSYSYLYILHTLAADQ